VITPSHEVQNGATLPSLGMARVLGACSQAEEQHVAPCPCLTWVPFQGGAPASAVVLSLVLQGSSCHPPGCIPAGFTPLSLPRSSPCAWCHLCTGKRGGSDAQACLRSSVLLPPWGSQLAGHQPS